MGGAEAAVVEAAAAEAAEGGEDGRMEGWLYLIRSNRLGLQTSRKRYFVLEDSALRCFKAAPAPSSSSSKREVPARISLVPPVCPLVLAGIVLAEISRHFGVL